MPNFPLSNSLKSHLIWQAQRLAGRARDYALANIPLTVEQIQKSVLDDNRVSQLDDLRRSGIRTIIQHNEIRLALLRKDNMPELRRSVVLKLHLPQEIYVERATQYGVRTTHFEINESHYLVPDFSFLSKEERRELVLWTEGAVKQTRMYVVTNDTVQEVLDACPTTSHLYAYWPSLTKIVDPAAARSSERETFRTWVERLRNPARRNWTIYQPKHDHFMKYAPRIKACADVQLAAGMILKDYTWQHDKEIVLEIEHHETLDTDLKI